MKYASCQCGRWCGGSRPNGLQALTRYEAAQAWQAPQAPAAFLPAACARASGPLPQQATDIAWPCVTGAVGSRLEAFRRRASDTRSASCPNVLARDRSSFHRRCRGTARALRARPEGAARSPKAASLRPCGCSTDSTCSPSTKGEGRSQSPARPPGLAWLRPTGILGDREPTVRERAAAGLFMADLYNGIENTLKRICRHCGVAIPSGGNWHVELAKDEMTSLRTGSSIGLS